LKEGLIHIHKHKHKYNKTKQNKHKTITNRNKESKQTKRKTKEEEHKEKQQNKNNRTQHSLPMSSVSSAQQSSLLHVLQDAHELSHASDLELYLLPFYTNVLIQSNNNKQTTQKS
jgi:outer membrane biosynthesis protein TonB